MMGWGKGLAGDGRGNGCCQPTWEKGKEKKRKKEKEREEK